MKSSLKTRTYTCLNLTPCIWKITYHIVKKIRKKTPNVSSGKHEGKTLKPWGCTLNVKINQIIRKRTFVDTNQLKIKPTQTTIHCSITINHLNHFCKARKTSAREKLGTKQKWLGSHLWLLGFSNRYNALNIQSMACFHQKELSIYYYNF